MRIFSWFVMALVACLFVIFAIANRELAVIRLWPFPFIFELPLYIMVIASIFGGFIWGALVMWCALGGSRRKAREMKIKAEQNARDLNIAREKLEKIQGQDKDMNDKLPMTKFLEIE